MPKDVHDILTAQEAFHLVAQREGVALLTKPTTLDTRDKKDVVVKPLADTALCFETCLVLRAHEESRLINEFVRSYLRKYAPDRLRPTQMELKLPAGTKQTGSDGTQQGRSTGLTGPNWTMTEFANSLQVLERIGGDDGTRTRGLCRDRAEARWD